MIVELVDGAGEIVGKFQSSAIPREGETVRYDDSTYLIEEVSWVVESTHNQNIKTVELLVERH